MKKSIAALLYSATVLAFTGLTEPAVAGLAQVQAQAVAVATSITQGWCKNLPSGIDQTCSYVYTPPNTTGACLMGGFGKLGITEGDCDKACQQVCSNMGGTWAPGIL